MECGGSKFCGTCFGGVVRVRTVAVRAVKQHSVWILTTQREVFCMVIRVRARNRISHGDAIPRNVCFMEFLEVCWVGGHNHGLRWLAGGGRIALEFFENLLLSWWTVRTGARSVPMKRRVARRNRITRHAESIFSGVVWTKD